MTQTKLKPKRVKALYNCVADNPDELTFSEGDVIIVDGEEDQEWWVSLGRGGGVFPQVRLPCPEQPQLSFLFLPTSEGSPLGWAGHVGCSFQSAPEGLQGGRGLGSLGLLHSARTD